MEKPNEKLTVQYKGYVEKESRKIFNCRKKDGTDLTISFFDQKPDKWIVNNFYDLEIKFVETKDKNGFHKNLLTIKEAPKSSHFTPAPSQSPSPYLKQNSEKKEDYWQGRTTMDKLKEPVLTRQGALGSASRIVQALVREKKIAHAFNAGKITIEMAMEFEHYLKTGEQDTNRRIEAPKTVLQEIKKSSK